jgi:hypothetical protein
LFSKIIYEQAWYNIVLCLIGASALALWLYYKNKRQSEAPQWMLRILLALRFSSFFVALILLLSILVRRVQTEKESPIIVLALDNSSSIVSGSDSSQIKPALLTRLQTLKSELAAKYTVKTILFGSETKAAELPDFKARETDIDQALRDVENDFGNQNVGALVLVTDGIYNKGGNPVYASEKSQFPIWTVGLGDTTEQCDVWIQKINHNEVAYLGNNFPVEVQVNARKCKNQTLKLGLYQNGTLLQSKDLTISHDPFSSLSTFTINAKAPGLMRYTVQISKADQEHSRDNNSASFVMEVISNQEKIALLSVAPHPDLAALREVLLTNSSSQVEQFQLPNLPSSFKAYNLVIIHGYGKENQSLITRCIADQVPYWVIAPSSFEGLTGLKVITNMTRFNDVEAIIDPAFGYFQLSVELRRFLPELSAVKSMFGRYEESNGSQVLLNQKLGNVESSSPLLMFQEVNGLKSCIFAGDGLWRWNMQDFAKHNNHQLFTELISKITQYLSVRSDKSFFRVHGPKIITENDNAEFSAELYNKSYEAIVDPEVRMVLRDQNGKTFNYTFSKSSKTYRLDLGTLSPGEYKWTAAVKFGAEVFEKQGVFVVKELQSEKLGTTANHGLLRQISSQTGGRYFDFSQIDSLQTRLLTNENIKSIVYSQNITSPLVDLKWLFWFILVLLSVEWWFRKRYFNI